MKRVFYIAMLVALAPLSAHAGDVKLLWQNPIVCADGSVADVNCPQVGDEISRSAVVDGTFTVVGTTTGKATEFVVRGLTPGKHCFQVKTLAGDAANPMKSEPSETVCTDVPFVPPKAPQGLTVTIVVHIEPAQ